MDGALLSILGTIAQVYASILGIIGMYLVFLRQRTDDKNRDLRLRAKMKSDSLIDFINREISPAYKNTPVIRTDNENIAEVIKAINQYWVERKTESPNLTIGDVKTLVVLWTIAQREKDELSQINNEVEIKKKKPVIPRLSSMLFIGYFLFVLTFSFFCIFLAYIENGFVYPLAWWIILLSIAGAFPLGNLFYGISKAQLSP